MISFLVALAPLLAGPLVTAPPVPSRVGALPEGEAPAAGRGPAFLENGGQWPAAARFRSLGGALGGAACAWFVDDGWWLVLRGADGGVRLSMRFEGGRGAPPAPAEVLPGRYHFMRGSDPAAFALGLAAFEQLRWRELYEGIDLLARPAGALSPGGAPATGSLFEYDLELAPGAALEAVVVRLAGHAGLALDGAGRLVVETAVGPLVQTPPRAWQMTPAGPVSFECRFRLLDGERFGFEAPDRDPRHPALVDPALIFSTYLSGSGAQTIEEIELAPNGDIFAAGTVESDAFPTTPGAFQVSGGSFEDAFVTRFTAHGQLIWSTYLGGTATDLLRGLAVDANGSATVCGATNSADFPTLPGSFDTTPNGFFDGFCARLAPTGDALSFATFLGGTLNDRAADLAVDPSGATTVVGTTNGGGFPVTSGAYDTSFNGGTFAGDAFCLRLSPDGTQLVWSTYFGGPSDDGATAVAVETSGEVTVGGVSSGPFPMSPGAFDTTFQAPGDAWVLRLDASGSQRVFSTWLGGAQLEEIRRILLDGSGAAVIAGRAEDAGFPVTAGALDTVFAGSSEGFVLELDAAGSALSWSTFVGGLEDDEVTGLAFAPDGGLVVAGNTTSADLPSTPGAFGVDFNGSLFGLFSDAFVLKLAPDTQVVEYWTYFGTADEDAVLDVAVDASGAAVLGGSTSSFSFPTTPGALQPTFNAQASREGFVSRLAFLRHPIPYGTSTPPGSGGLATIEWVGFPDLATNDFRVRLNSAPAGKKAILFHGFAPQTSPFYSGTIHVKPPLFRERPVQTDAFGFKSLKVDLDPAWVGQTVYFQWWFKDPLLKKQGGLSNALEVLVHP